MLWVYKCERHAPFAGFGVVADFFLRWRPNLVLIFSSIAVHIISHQCRCDAQPRQQTAGWLSRGAAARKHPPAQKERRLLELIK